MTLTVTYFDSSIRSDGGDGSAGSPYTRASANDIRQWVLDNIMRDTTNGDEVRDVSTTTADTLTATLSLTAYGTPNSTAPLVLSGGIADLNGGAYAIRASTNYLRYCDMHIRNGTGTELLILQGTGQKAHQVTLSDCTGRGVTLGSSSGCGIYEFSCFDCDVGVYFAANAEARNGAIWDGTERNFTTAIDMNMRNSAEVSHCQILMEGTASGQRGIKGVGSYARCHHNSLRCTSTDGTGIEGNFFASTVKDNIVSGFSKGIDNNSSDTYTDRNSVYEATTKYEGITDWANFDNEELTEDPFTDADSFDFSLTGVGNTQYDLTRNGVTVSYYKGAVPPSGGGGGSTVIIQRRQTRL